MKRIFCAMLFLVAVVAGSGAVFAQGEEPTIYVIKKGDTLWGLSDRFMKDPYYWPDLWANNQYITNPHLVFPGQKVKIYPDRIVIEGAPPAAEPNRLEPLQPPAQPVQAAPEKTFSVSGGVGFILEKDVVPAGYIITTHQNRHLMGEDDIVYTDIGRKQGAKVGDRYSIFQDAGPISHPVTSTIVGNKILPLGALQLAELESKASKAIITKSFMEIDAGSYLMPYRDRRREVALKAATSDAAGYIIDTQTGNKMAGAGDVVFLDLGSAQRVEVGNLLYVAREVVPDQQYVHGSIDKLPEEVVGAVVVVETGTNTSTALIVKSIDTIYTGDRVELKKSR